MTEKSLSENKKKAEYSQTEEKDGVTTRIRVREVNNGFVINVSRYGYVGTAKGEQYIDENEEFISTTNPLEKKQTTIKEEINNALKNLTV
jgi:hypothetical protein